MDNHMKAFPLANNWSRFGALAVALLLPGLAAAADLVLLGTHPTSPLTAYPTIHTLRAFNGNIYMGYGDWNFFPAVVVTSFDPASNAFHLEFSANTDSIGILREINGGLYVPHIDPMLYADSRDYSYRLGGVWRDSKPAGMLHVFDIGSTDGSDLWMVGSRYITETTWGPAVFRSPDGGETWQDITIPSALTGDDGRHYWGFPLRGRFYVRDTYYEGTNGTRTATAPYRHFNSATLMRDGTNEFVVGVTGWVSGVGGPVPRLLVTYDTQSWRTIRPGNVVYHFTVNGSNLFTLETNASVNALWMASTVTSSQAVWQRLNFNNVPLNAKAIEVHNGVVYVGDTQGRLWAGRLDEVAITPRPTTVVNELPDDFGRALSFDGDALAVGAPDHSGAVPLCGQVTVWQHQGDTWIESARIDPPAPSFSGWFGKDLVLKGDLLAVIEVGRDLSRRDRGSSAQVHLYQRTGQNWTLRQSLNHPYAQSIAVDSGWLAVGTGGTDNATNSFALYTLDRIAGGLRATLRTNIIVAAHLPVEAAQNFWRPTARIAMESNLCVFATIGDSDFLGGPGEVQIYQRDETDVWHLAQVLHSPSPTPAGLSFPPDRFGSALGLHDGWLVIGAPRDDTSASQAGAVHIYERTNNAFVLRQSVFSPFHQDEAAFGASVALNGLNGSTLLVGSPGLKVTDRRHHGAVTVFRRDSNWTAVTEVLSPPESSGEFGATVALGANWLAASSRFSNSSSNLANRVVLWPFGPAEGELGIPRKLANCAVALTAKGELGRKYYLEATDTLSPPNWSTLFPFTLNLPAAVLEDATQSAGEHRFYRLRSD
jgi:hypothetical protein